MLHVISKSTVRNHLTRIITAYRRSTTPMTVTLLGNPLVLGGIIATAIAVSFALANRKKTSK